MSVTISWEDMATPWVEDVIKVMPNMRRRALKSLGWWMQKEIREGIKSGAPGGRRYAPLSGIKRKKDTAGRSAMKKGSAKGKVLGKLGKAVGYQYKEEDGSVSVGWLSKSAVYLGSIQEKGKTVAVTGKMRNFWWESAWSGVKRRSSRSWWSSAGSDLDYGMDYDNLEMAPKGAVFLRRRTKQINLPARPTIGPMRQVLTPRIPGYFVKKIDGYMDDDMKTPPKRKHKVYGSWW